MKMLASFKKYQSKISIVREEEEEKDSNMLQTVEISISASNLINASRIANDTPTPIAIVTLLRDDRSMEPIVLGETEVIKNTQNPEWTKTFIMNYDETSEKPSFVLAKIMDTAHDMEMGDGVFSVGELLKTDGNSMTKKLRSGTLTIKAVKVVGKGTLKLKINGILKNARLFTKKSIPFYKLARKEVSSSGVEFRSVYKSRKFDKNSLYPTWEEEIIDLNLLCSGKLDLPLLLSVHHYKSNGEHVLMGEVETTVAELISIQISGKKLQIKKAGKATGTIDVDNARHIIEFACPIIKINEESRMDTARTFIYEGQESIRSNPPEIERNFSTEIEIIQP